MVDPPDPWPTIAARLGPRRNPAGWLALAATLVLAVALPWKLQHDAVPAVHAPDATPAPRGELESLYAQSAQLESLVAYARDDRVASGSAEAVATRPNNIARLGRSWVIPTTNGSTSHGADTCAAVAAQDPSTADRLPRY
jgi:hypothetical protein